MSTRWCVLLVLTLASTMFAAQQPTASPESPAKAGYSQEAAVIEEMTTQIGFEDSGNYTREQTSRVQIKTDAGVKDWGLLSFPYQSATQTIEIEYVRVRKPDGSTIVS